jgi:hypothetical protein
MSALLASSVRGRVAVGPNAGQGVTRLGDWIDPDRMDDFQSARTAMVSGFSVHANVAVEARDRTRLERLLSYAARPAVATDRLSELDDGRLHYRLKHPWRDGTTAVIFERQDFIAKLSALVPAPRAHLTRYHGVLGPAAAWRPAIVPAEKPARGPAEVTPAAGSEVPPSEAQAVPSESRSSRNTTWAELMRRVFLVDVLRCEGCGGRMKILAAIRAPTLAARILDCLGMPSRAPPVSPSSSEFDWLLDSI